MKVITLPLRIDNGIYKKATRTKKAGDKKKSDPLNLNFYRNANHFKLADMKIKYKDIVEDELKRVGLLDAKYNKVRISYTLYAGNNRKFDLSNIQSIVQKFFEDSLQELGLIEDDTYEYIVEYSCAFGGIDKGNERVEIEISEVANEKS